MKYPLQLNVLDPLTEQLFNCAKPTIYYKFRKHVPTIADFKNMSLPTKDSDQLSEVPLPRCNEALLVETHKPLGSPLEPTGDT